MAARRASLVSVSSAGWPRLPPLSRGELRALSELRTTACRAAVPEPPPGRGRTVLLVPGFGAPEWSLRPLARWLRTGDWVTIRADLGSVVGCSQRHVTRLSRRLEAALDASAPRAVVIGQSRGGLLARALAVQHPHLIETAIGLGSPVCDQFAVQRLVRAQVELLATLGSLGVRGLMSRSCQDGRCCAPYRDALVSPPPPDVRLVSIYSPTDGVVDPEACRDPFGECVPVDASHMGMGVNAQVWERLAEVLT